MTLKTVRFVTVATGIYRTYWKSLVESFSQVKKSVPRHFKVSFAVLTDDADEILSFASQRPDLDITVLDFMETSWPEATILRYEGYSRHKSLILQDIDYVIHIDADMILKSWPDAKLWEELEQKDLLLVRHPGYFRSERAFIRTIAKVFGATVPSDAVRMQSFGAIGDWETNVNSSAFTPLNQRKYYFCGGVWFAKASMFDDFVETISNQVRLDSQNGVVAKWHDESHLNSWAAQNINHYGTLDPSYCFARGYFDLIGLRPVIEVVEKGSHKVR